MRQHVLEDAYSVAISDDPQLLPLPDGIRALSVDFNSDPYTLHRVLYDESGDPIEIEQSIELPTGSGQVFVSGTESGSVLLLLGNGELQGTIYKEVAISSLSTLGTYEWQPPASNPHGAKWGISEPTTKDNRAYWYELEFDNTAQTHDWILRSAALGSIGETTQDARFTESNATIDTGTLEDLHMPQDFGFAVRPPWFDAGIWQIDALFQYWKDGSWRSAAKTIEFPSTEKPSIGSPFSGPPNGIWRHLIRGNLGPQEDFNFPGDNALAGRFKQDRLYHPEWASDSSLGSLHAFDLIDNTFVYCEQAGFNTTRLLRGRFDETSPSIEILFLNDASSLLPGSDLRPRYGIWLG